MGVGSLIAANVSHALASGVEFRACGSFEGRHGALENAWLVEGRTLRLKSEKTTG